MNDKEIKKGYKQTDVGIIPEDWELKSIGAVCQIFGRIGFRGYTVDDIVDEGEGAITISPSNIKDNKIDFKQFSIFLSSLKVIIVAVIFSLDFILDLIQ